MRWSLAMAVLMMPWCAVAGPLAKEASTDPEGYVDDVAVLIQGYGVAGAIDAAGLYNVVAMARADVRAMAQRRLIGADLDGDGAVSGAEVRLTAAAASATTRGRMLVYFAKADSDGDDLVTAAELQAYAAAVALKSFSDAKAQAVYAVIGFDGDGDGLVTVDEVRRQVMAVASARRDPREIDNEFEGDDPRSDPPGRQDQPPWGNQGSHLAGAGGEPDQRHHGEAAL